MKRLALLLALLAAPAAGGEAFAPVAKIKVFPGILDQVYDSPLVGACDEITDAISVPDVCGSTSTTLLTASISAYWSLDDQFFGATANYESKVADNSLDLTPTNDPLRAPSANRLPAAQFVDGSTEYLAVADPWTSGDIDFSVGCWVYIDDLTGDLPIASKDDGTQQEWRLYFDDNTTDAWVFEIFDGAGASRGTVSSAEVPTATTWTLVVGAHDAANNEVGVSVNGAAYTTAATTGLAVDTDDPFELGRMTAATYMDGRLSNCFFIKEELSAADLGDLYNNGVPVPSRQFAARVATAAEGLWDLSELSGNRSDFTSNAVTLTDTNTVLHGAGLAPRAYNAASLVAASSERLHYDATTADWLLGDADFTLIGKVLSTDLSGDDPYFGAFRSAGNYMLFQDDANPNEALTFRVRPTACGTNIDVSTAAGTMTGLENTWMTVAGTHDAANNLLGVSLNGAAKVTAAHSTGVCTTSSNFNVGAMNADYLNGRAGPFALYSAVLTDAQLAKWHAGGAAFSCESLPWDLQDVDGDGTSEIVSCCDLDEQSGTRTCSSLGSSPDISLTDTNTVLYGEGIADIPGGVTLRVADFEASTSEYLTTASSAQFTPGDTDFTWWAWVKPESVDTKVIYGKTSALNTASVGDWMIYHDTLDYFCRVSDGSSFYTTAPGAEFRAFAVGVYNLILCKHDASANNVRASQNGSVFNSGVSTAGAVPNSSATAVSIGAESDGGLPFDGLIGPVGWVSGTAFTDAQAALLYNSGDALNCSDIEDVVGVAPTVCWNLLEASGTRSATIGTADLTDNNTVLSTGGLVRGNTGHALQLSESATAYSTLSDAATISFSGDFSAWGWYYLDATNVGYIWGKRNILNNEIEYHLLQNSLTFQFTVADGSTTFGSISSAIQTAGQWYFYAVSHDSVAQELSMTIIETAVTPVSYTAGMYDGTQSFSVGRPGDWNANYANGVVDELGIGAFVLTDTQITCLYNSGLGRSYAELAAGACAE